MDVAQYKDRNPNKYDRNKFEKNEIDMIWEQKEDKYYVYFYDFSDKNNDVESAITSKLSESRVYRVDIKSGFNSNFMSDTSNVKAQKKEELKINGVTLIVIENGKNINYIEGSDNIVTFINK